MTMVGIWIAAFLTLAIYSFLYKDNPFYKLAEHLYVGVSAGYMVIYVWSTDVRPLLLDPFVQTHLQTGSWAVSFSRHFVLFIPATLGVVMLLRTFPKISWISRWPISFLVGITAGLALTGDVQGWLFPQVQATLVPLWVGGSILTTFNNILLFVGVVGTVAYFYFSREHKGFLGGLSRVGILFIMVAFGASFGYTVMARISLLIGRIDFLFADWLHLVH
jgi:hypothetical protein